MKKFILILTVAIAALSLSSCCTINHISFEDSGARFEQRNFHVVNTVSKECSATYLFFVWGGSAMNSQLNKAIAEMSKDLRPNQALAFINVVDAVTLPLLLPIYFRVECQINATVIEYDN